MSVKYIRCPSEGCKGIIAHMTGKMVSIRRSRQHFQILGNDYSVIATCPFMNCNTRVSIICRDGKIDTSLLKLEDPNLSNKKDGEKVKKEDKEKGGKQGEGVEDREREEPEENDDEA